MDAKANNSKGNYSEKKSISNSLARVGDMYSLGLKPRGIPFINECIQKGFTVDHCEDSCANLADEKDIMVLESTRVVLKKNGVTCSPKFDDLFDLEVYCWKNLEHYNQLSQVVVAA
ncbi:MAG: hypothetical protein D6B27_07595 [Gammaproteobacteria bacterium]|nr:MAG: hypothetical protein D6B27_07595 [Gammaproteobacteria bacterium]